MELFDNKKVLILSPAGDDALFYRWIFPQQPYELVLLYYADAEDVAEEYRQNPLVNDVLVSKGFKWHLIAEYIKSHAAYISGFDYIWFPDDDIDMSPEDIIRYFNIHIQHDLWLSQPALSGFGSHEITYPRSGNILRFTNFVEVMAPMFKVSEIHRLIDTFTANDCSWGLDWVWPALLGNPEDKVAVVDDVIMLHTRPIKSRQLYGLLDSSPKEEADRVIEQFIPGFTRVSICYGGIRKPEYRLSTQEHFTASLFNPLQVNATKPAQALIIGGFHRSGTSMLAQMIHKAGLPIALDELGANFSNKDGHFEDNVSIAMHDKLLSQLGTNWQYAKDRTLPKTGEQYSAISQYIHQRKAEGEGVWALKDPRLCLFLESWYQALQGHGRFVFVFRDWEESVQSLFSRHAKSIAHQLTNGKTLEDDLAFWCEPELAANMWISYNRRIIEFVKKYPDICLVISHRDIMNGFDVIDAINNKFNLSLQTLDETVQKPELANKKIDAFIIDILSTDTIASLNAVYEELNALCDSPAIQTKSTIIENRPLHPERQQLISLFEKAKHHITNDMKTEQVMAVDCYNAQELTRLIPTLLPKLDYKSIHTIKPLVEQLLKLNAEHIRAHEWMGQVLMVAGDFEHAEQAFLRAIALSSPDVQPESYMKLANLYFRIEQYELTNFYCQKVLMVNPQHGFANSRLAQVCLENQQYGRAEQFIQKALEANPSNIWFQQLLLKCYLLQDKMPLARKMARQFWNEYHQFEMGKQLYNILLELKTDNSEAVYSEVVSHFISRERVNAWIGNNADVIGSIGNPDALEYFASLLLENWQPFIDAEILLR